MDLFKIKSLNKLNDVKDKTIDERYENNQNIYKLKIERKLENNKFCTLPLQKHSTIGYRIDDPIKHEVQPQQLNVVRKRRDEILKIKRRDVRRNTIDVNQLDLIKAKDTSKSINSIDQIDQNLDFHRRIDELSFNTHLNGASMPELDKIKTATLNNIKIRRQQQFVSTERLDDPVRSNGPEFIVKSSYAPKQIDITDFKCPQRGVVNILLLNGQTLQIACNPTITTARQIFEAVIKSENMLENFFVGLCALIGGDFVFLPMEVKIYKVAPQIWIDSSKKSNYLDNSIFTLFLRIKFFLPTLRGVSSLESRHLLYLQLRKSILERHILCTDDDLISLGGLALQAEVGDFTEIMKSIEYFTSSHYLPEGILQKNKKMVQYLRNSHLNKKGLHSLEAEHCFIRHVQELKEYGLHLYSAVWSRDDNTNFEVYIAISIAGINIFQRNSNCKFSGNAKTTFHRRLYEHFEWLEIENLCFSKHVLCVVVRRSESLSIKDKKRVKYKFVMDSRKSYFAFNLASEHHKFYMKLRNSFISLKTLSDELNLPLTTPTTIPVEERRKIIVEPPVIEKPVKMTVNRVKNFKKSMLNDNRLLKLKERFLKRSKSSVEIKESSKCDEKGTMEENQNKENEFPRIVSLESSPQSLTLNRNKVKMGTRAFSSQFLNKSFDNIYDSPNGNLSGQNYDDEDELSMKSSNYFSSEQKSPQQSEAYVLHSSIKSINQNFSIQPNETVSDSLLEKFNNISCNSTINDRIISKITIVKDRVYESNVKYATLNSNRLTKEVKLHKNSYITKSQEIRDFSSKDNQTLGISIVQGTDNYVYVINLLKNGPGERNGIQIGDQIIAVNGRTLLNLPYETSLKLLQNTGKIVELIVSQVYRQPKETKSPRNVDYFKHIRYPTEEILQQQNEVKHLTNFYLNTSKSVPDLPKIIATIPKKSEKIVFPRTMGLSRRYEGPVRYPVTPGKTVTTNKPTLSGGSHQLSLLADSDDEQVFI